MLTSRSRGSGRRTDRGEEAEEEQGPQDEVMSQWIEATRRNARHSMALEHGPKQTKRMGTLGDLAALALHGDNKLRTDDVAFLQRFSTSFARAAPLSKLDSVTFNFGDRVAAWLSGMGRELRQLKEIQLDDPGEADGSRQRQTSTITKIHRRSLVLVGAEETMVQKQRAGHGTGDLTSASGPAIISSMTSMMLRAHFEAAVFDKSQGKASAAELRKQVEDLAEHHGPNCLDRAFLLFTDAMTESEKAELRHRYPQTLARDTFEPAAHQHSTDASGPAERMRISVADMAAGGWTPEPSSRHSAASTAEVQPRRDRVESATSVRSRGSFVSAQV